MSSRCRQSCESCDYDLGYMVSASGSRHCMDARVRQVRVAVYPRVSHGMFSRCCVALAQAASNACC
jgi:hypothetical protein